MNSNDYQKKAEMMLEQPRNYILDEFPDVIAEVGIQGEDQLADDLEDVYVEQMAKRDQDPDEAFEVDDEFKQFAWEHRLATSSFLAALLLVFG